MIMFSEIIEILTNPLFPVGVKSVAWLALLSLALNCIFIVVLIIARSELRRLKKNYCLPKKDLIKVNIPINENKVSAAKMTTISKD